MGSDVVYAKFPILFDIPNDDNDKLEGLGIDTESDDVERQPGFQFILISGFSAIKMFNQASTLEKTSIWFEMNTDTENGLLLEMPIKEFKETLRNSGITIID